MLVRSRRGLVALSGSEQHVQREVVQKGVGRGFVHNRLITAAVPAGGWNAVAGAVPR